MDDSKLKLEKLRRFYQKDPVAYAHDVLKTTWWSKQEEIALSVVENTHTIARACHSVGKSHLLGGLINWHYDCFNPSITLASANSENQVDDVIFKEVRLQRGGRPGLMPAASRMGDSVDHFAHGLTAKTATAFQGRHEKNVFVAFDEATEIAAEFFQAAEGMLTTPECRFLCTLNPTDTTSEIYNQELSGRWNVIPISVLEHPNIIAELEGRPPLYPQAVRLDWVKDKITTWCTPISASDHKAADVEFPPLSNIWHRPGPLFEGRCLGRYPTTGSTSIWNEAIWLEAQKPQTLPHEPLKVGVDVARFGDDYTSIILRRGSAVLCHETHNGYSVVQSANLIKQLVKQFSEVGENPNKVDIYIDDGGVGGGLVDILKSEGHNALGINSAESAIDKEGYPNRRSELWFTVAERANEGMLDLSRLNKGSLKLLRNQAFAPTWKMDNKGRRVVEMKCDTKKRISRSPDDMDALNLAFTIYLKPIIGKGTVQTANRGWTNNIIHDAGKPMSWLR